jgi:hypothetical protein
MRLQRSAARSRNLIALGITRTGGRRSVHSKKLDSDGRMRAFDDNNLYPRE